MDTPPRIRFGALTIMTSRPGRLARFYAKLLSWSYLREERPHPDDPDDASFAIICPPEGVIEPALLFN